MAEDRISPPGAGVQGGEPSTGARDSASSTVEPPVPALGGAARGSSSRWLPSRSLLVALGIVAVFEIAIGFVPLFGGPGYESSLATGIFVPSVVAVATAIGLARQKREPFDGFCQGVANGAMAVSLALAISMAHGLRVGFCDLLMGLENFALGPGVGALLAGVWGWLVSEIAGSMERRWLRRFLLVTLGVAGPLATIAFSVARFYSSPMIFAYDPFVGFFSGSIYDTIIDLTGVITYRAGSAATLFALFVAALHLVHDHRGRLSYQSIGRPGLLALGVASAIASIVITLSGPKLGHYQTRDTIAEALGAVLKGDRCEVIYPRSLPVADAQRFARECESHVAANEAWLGVTGTPRITAFLFRDEGQKAALTGAGGTSIAKPWRHEIYVQVQGYPHHSLGHELMHVVAGDAARGPFRVAGAISGLLPDPGLIEGVAVASNPRDDDLAPAEWARAMKDLGILPPLSRLFAFGFFGENSATAYTVSGAFVGFVHDRFGAEVIRRWYGGEALPAVVGQSWAQLEEAWHGELDKIVLPVSAQEQAKARFDRPGLFSRRCPRTVDECREKSRDLAGSGDAKGAIAELERAQEFDPHSEGLRIDIAELRAQAGEPEKSETELRAIAQDESLTRHARDQAMEAVADIELARGEADAALAKYEELLGRAFEESKLRTLNVKAYAAREPKARDALVTLLIGRPGRKPDRVQASEMLSVLDQRAPENGLYAYLMARFDTEEEDYETADKRLESALARQLDVPHIRLEAQRLRVIVACARNDVDVARRVFADYAKNPDGTRSRVDSLRRFLERCTQSVIADPNAQTPTPAGQK